MLEPDWVRSAPMSMGSLQNGKERPWTRQLPERRVAILANRLRLNGSNRAG
jgi:hypothetical protein